ncbi:PAS domain S-box protein [Vibrio sp. 11-4(1)]|uniref:PAS domain S-box protein n=1 Tax=Vibrio sp. 11-4(1) TaxID=2591018 RepID=UPI001483AA6F|nr:PAS domain S-box protein [Vibrio sp. 11-4(1)]NNN80575.1 PAS domain S-box protein [Vibrio sp. 11-4(1)]
MKFSIKLPLLFFVLSLVMLSAVTFVSWKGKDILQDTTLTNIEREATLLIRLIERNLFERYHDVQAFKLSLGQLEGSHLYKRSFNSEVVDNLNHFVKNYKVYRRIIILDTNGNILAYNSENPFGKKLKDLNITPNEIRDSIWFQEAMSGITLEPKQPESSYVTGPNRYLIDSDSNSFDMIFASVIRNTNGQKIGLWVNVVDFSAVEKIVEETYELLSSRGLQSAELTILDDQGRIIVDYDPVGQSKPRYARDFGVLSNLNLASNGVEGARLAVAGLSGSNISRHFRKQVQQVTGYAHTSGAYDYPGLGWSAMIRVGVDEAFYESDSLFKNTLLLSILILGLILLISFYLGKQIARPLSELALSVKRLASGEKNIKLPAIYGKNELAIMVSELDNLKEIVIERERLSKETDEQRFLLDIQSKAIDSTASGIIVTDINQKDYPIIFANRAFEVLTGYSKEEVIGRNCRFLQGNDREQEGLDRIREALENQSSISVILRNYRKDGTLFYNNLRIDPVFDDENKITHFIGIITDITEIKRREEETKIKLESEIQIRTKEARESETRLRTVFDTALDGTVVIDINGIILDLNRSTELIFGRVREELIGENVSILMPPQYAHEHDDYIRKFLFTGDKKLIGTPRKVEGLHKSGRVFPIEISVGETKVDDSQVFVGIIKDITNQEETKKRELILQNELREREIIYRAAFSQAAVGICRVSLEGKFIEVNDKMCDIFGYSEEQLLCMSIEEITHPDDLYKSRIMITSLIEGKKRSFAIDKRYISKTKEMFWATVSVSVVLGEDEQPKYFISVIEDISNRKKIEKELRSAKRSRDELLRGMRLASDAGGISNWVLNLKSGVLKWDDKMYELYGVQKGSKLTVKDWEKALHPDDYEQATKAFNESLKTKDVFNAEFRIINQSTNQIRWIKAAGDVVFDKESGDEMVFGINVDITDERNAQAALERETLSAKQANEAKSRFLATMSHEIRTPMNGVIGMVDLLKETNLSKDQHNMVRTIRDSSFSLLEIINDILDFSKIESGKMELDFTNVNIINLIEKTLDALWVNAHQKGIGLYLYFENNIPKELLLDTVRVRQILLNLLGNAIKFTSSEEQKGVIKLCVGYQNNRLIVSVEDNGVGMSSEQVSRLFTPFAQADGSTTRKFGGTGLGLSISKSFVELMGGEIEVSSKLGHGSCFSFTIPAESNDSSSLLNSYELSNFKVVLKIDDENLSDIVRKMLSNLKVADVLSEIEKLTDQHELSIYIGDQANQLDEHSKYRVLEVVDNPTATKGYIKPNKYVIGTHPFKPSDFITALAVLSGHESPDFDWSECLYDEDNSQFDTNDEDKSGITILCAEDQPTNQLVLSQQLDRLGFSYEMASDGKEALERWLEGDYDLVLTDCHMPQMDGFELTSEIRRIEEERGEERTLIIALTANAMLGEAEHCLEAGMDDYITKPVELRTLKKVLWLRLRGKDLRQKVDRKPIDISHMNVSEDTDSRGLIDYHHLSAVIGSDNEEVQRAVLSMFWANIVTDIEKLEAAIQEANFEQVRSLAHGAKGAATSSGVLALGDLFKSLEENYIDVSKTSALVRDIKQLIKQVEIQLMQENII